MLRYRFGSAPPGLVGARMLLDLSRFRAGAEHISRRFEPSEFGKASDDFQVVSPVTLDVDVRKDGEKVRLVGRVKATLQVECSRCVEPFTIPVDSAVDTMFL